MSIVVAHGMKKTGTGGYSVEVQAVINRFIAGGQPLTAAEILKVVAFVDGSVTDGNWSLLDEFWWSKGIESELKTRIGFKALTLTRTGVPTWVITDGWGGFSNAKYYRTGFIPSVNGINYKLNDAMMGAWGSLSTSGNLMGVSDLDIGGNVLLGVTSVNVINNTANPIGSAGTGLFTVVRLAANSFKTYKNGVVSLSSSEPSTILPAKQIYIGLRNQNGAATGVYSGNIYCALVGAGVGVNQATLYSRINTLINT